VLDVAEITDLLAEATGPGKAIPGSEAGDDYTHDESLTGTAQVPAAVVFPTSTADVAAVLRLAAEHTIPVTARGSGTGLSGAAIPVAGGIVVSFERMDQVIEVDTENHVAVVQPGVTLHELDAVLAAHGLIYPVFPGEYTASLGGNVATNAGGMRAVKYGVTRHQVLGLEAVLPGGEIIRTGGRYVKSSTGYDLTQLIVGSEGTLALVTEATLRVYPRPPHLATVLAPFPTLDQVMTAVPKVVTSGVDPLILEYIDRGTMGAMAARSGLELGIPDDVKETVRAYLVVMLESHHVDRLDQDLQAVSELMSDLGALDVYVLPPASGTQLIEAREQAFWIAKAAGAHDIVDVVVPRASMAEFMQQVGALAKRTGSHIAGCGHAGDGNVHLSVFQPDPERRSATLRELFAIGLSLGGAISGEHGIGTAKRRYFLDLEDPTKVALMRRIKAAFDPTGIMNPTAIFGDDGQQPD
jgi:glycolate oxidase